VIITNAINSPLPTSLALGGTNAALTASNGGIFYSTASAGAILSGTATANQTLMSGASTSPTWSTATYLPTTTANQLLYSSGTNAIGELATDNSACLVSDTELLPIITSYPVWSLPMQDGQIIIGGTSGRPEPFNLTSNSTLTITNGSGSITIDSHMAMLTASNSASLNFDNVFSPNYVSYRMVLKNIFPHNSFANLYLRFGTGTTNPNYISSGYTYQLLDVSNNGANVTYPGYTGSTFSQALLTYAANQGISNLIPYDGVCGYIDLFVTSGTSNVASGISRLSYESANNVVRYVNTTCAFQLPEDNYTSVQLLMSDGLIYSGTAYLYGFST